MTPPAPGRPTTVRVPAAGGLTVIAPRSWRTRPSMIVPAQRGGGPAWPRGRSPTPFIADAERQLAGLACLQHHLDGGRGLRGRRASGNWSPVRSTEQAQAVWRSPRPTRSGADRTCRVIPFPPPPIKQVPRQLLQERGDVERPPGPGSPSAGGARGPRAKRRGCAGCPGRGGLSGSARRRGLHQEQAVDDLQVVLHPVIDLAQQQVRAGASAAVALLDHRLQNRAWPRLSAQLGLCSGRRCPRSPPTASSGSPVSGRAAHEARPRRGPKRAGHRDGL